MNILVACKIVPDDQDIKSTDNKLDFSKAKPTVSAYDLNAIEAAAILKSTGTVKVISVGPKKIDDSKTKKNILARGVDEILITADDTCDGLDAFSTAAHLKALVEASGAWDVILVGDGSADMYAKQTGIHLAAVLDVPYVSGIISGDANDDKILVKRLLSDHVDSVEVPTPCVLAIAPEFAEPRICGMKDILAAGKKPMIVKPATISTTSAIVELSVNAPDQVERKRQIFTDIDEFTVAVRTAL